MKDIYTYYFLFVNVVTELNLAERDVDTHTHRVAFSYWK